MEATETAKEYRLEQFIKWRGGWEALYYGMSTREREALFDRLEERIEEFEATPFPPAQP